MIDTILNNIAPYEFSWIALVFFGLSALCYFRGASKLKARGNAESKWRVFAFWLGLGLCYAVLHTRFDYFAQYMFFVHRGQHLVLHHLGPILIALSAPWTVLKVGFPEGRVKDCLGRILNSRVVKRGYRIIQQPLLAAFIFVGLIFFWLTPEIHFDAMLSQNLYLLMNWSMFLDGLLFWWLVLDPQDPRLTKTLGFGLRIILLWASMIPQLILGASIVFRKDMLYDVYSVCGRAWPIDPMNDQILGGLLTWIPPGMMTVLVTLVVLRRFIRYNKGADQLSSEQSRKPEMQEA